MSIRDWLKKLFDNTPPPFRPRPVDWTKTLADLQAENRNLTGEEISWARDYDRDQLRAWVRFPKDGEEFEALQDLKVSYLIAWRAPYSTGGEGILPKGTRVRVAVHAGDAEPVGVYATPVEEKRIGELLVPEDDRLSSKYGGYSLFLDVAGLNRDFRLVSPA